MFTPQEERFLRVEHAVANLREMADLRTFGCPDHIYQDILRHRARKLAARGIKLPSAVEQLPSDDLDAKIAGARLW